jgi:hypothetical protein
LGDKKYIYFLKSVNNKKCVGIDSRNMTMGTSVVGKIFPLGIHCGLDKET